ncbi:MAG: sodium/solute symporter [Planctomycetota bacterium]
MLLHSSRYSLYLLALLGLASVSRGEQIDSRLAYQHLPDLPYDVGVAGPFVGAHNDALIVAGGANFPDQPYWENPKVWHDDAWVLTRTDAGLEWLSGYSVGAPIAYGAVAVTPQGVVCLGGDTGEVVTDRCFLLAWDPGRRELVEAPLPKLPEPCAYGAAAAIGEEVYLIGGQSGQTLDTATDRCWRIDLSATRPAWGSLAAMPGGVRAFHQVVAQHNGFETRLYAFGGRRAAPTSDAPGAITVLSDHYEYSPSKKQWRRRADLPSPRMAGAAVAVGQSHVFTLTGADGSLWNDAATLKLGHPGFPKRALAYHTITDTWVDAGPTPANPVTTPATRWGERVIIASGERQPGVRTAAVWSIGLADRPTEFGGINFTVLAAYLLGMVAVGVYFARRNKSTDDYFRGGKKVVWWAAGCSIFATMLSSITFMAIPAKAYAQDLVYLAGNLTIFAVAPIAVYVALPFFRGIDATSAYEYLEKRFNRWVRWFASLFFTLFHIFRMGIVLSLAGLTLAAITPLTPGQCVLIMGGLSIAYCTLGGVEAVIWTDTLQTVVLLGGAITCLILLLLRAGDDPSELFATAAGANKLRWANFSSDPTSASLAFWVVLLGGVGQNLSSYTADQAVVQRYMTTPDKRRAANSIWFAAVLAIPASLIFYSMGVALYLFYRSHPEKLDPGFNTDQILPLFIATELPAGVAGLLVAGIFAAAQSTVSTSMNSTATALVTDFLRPLGALETERGYLNAARGMTLTLGVIGTGVGLLFVAPDIRSLFDQFVRVIGVFMGVLGGLFALGVLTRRASGGGALCGALIGGIVMTAMPYFSEINGFLYATIGIAICFTVGYAASLLTPPPEGGLEGLTLSTIGAASPAAVAADPQPTAAHQ